MNPKLTFVPALLLTFIFCITFLFQSDAQKYGGKRSFYKPKPGLSCLIGDIVSSTGNKNIYVCSGDGVPDEISFSVEVNPMNLEVVYVVTDWHYKILKVLDSNVMDFEDSGPGVCFVFAVGYRNWPNLEIGDGIYHLNRIGHCTVRSRNYLRVTKSEVSGGTISTDDPTEICTGDGVSDQVNVTVEGTAGPDRVWVITDSDGNILSLPNAPPFEFEGTGSGTSVIWQLGFGNDLMGLEVGANVADLTGCHAFSNSIEVIKTGVDGGTISTDDPTMICAGDGIDDPINVTIEGAMGPNQSWVVTDADGNILSLSMSSPFNFEGAGEGACLIWNISHTDDLEGLEVGANISDLSGCYDLSNEIAVERTGVDGGTISTGDPTTICALDGVDNPINVTLEGAVGSNQSWVVTDSEGNILSLSMSSPFSFEGTGSGTSVIWNISHTDDLEGLEVGANISDLSGCYDLSNEIAVERTGVDGGTISTGDPTTICALDGVDDPVNVTLEGAVGSNQSWVVTDPDGNILSLSLSTPFNFEGAGEGTCVIWNISHDDDLMGLEVGANLDDLTGCYDLSNEIAVTREIQQASIISSSTGDPEFTFCVSDAQPDIVQLSYTGSGTMSGSEMNYVYLVTDENDDILMVTEEPEVDFTEAPPGECHIWGLSYSGNLLAEEGISAFDELSDLCYMLSDNFITVTRVETGDPCAGSFTGGDTQLTENEFKASADGLGHIIIEGMDSKEPAHLRLFSITGQLIFQKQNYMPTTGDLEETVYIGSPVAGIYILQIKQGLNIESRRIFIPE